MKFVSVAVASTESSDKTVHLARQADSIGYDQFMVAAESPDARDTFAIQAICADSTKRLRIGCSVTNPFNRHPVIMAAAAATINEISGGRAVIGLGAGGVSKLGKRPAGAAPAIRKTINIMRAMWTGQVQSFSGIFPAERVSLKFVRKPAMIPILVTSLSPMVERVAGELADMAMVGATHISKENYENQLANIKRGAESGKRSPEDFAILPHLYLCCSRDGDLARKSSKVFTAHSALANSELETVKRKVPKDMLTKIEEGMKRLPTQFYLQYSIPDELDSLVTEDLVNEFVVAGTPDECVKKAREIISYGFSAIQFYIVPVLGHKERYLGYQESLVSLGEAFPFENRQV